MARDHSHKRSAGLKYRLQRTDQYLTRKEKRNGNCTEEGAIRSAAKSALSHPYSLHPDLGKRRSGGIDRSPREWSLRVGRRCGTASLVPAEQVALMTASVKPLVEPLYAAAANPGRQVVVPRRKKAAVATPGAMLRPVIRPTCILIQASLQSRSPHRKQRILNSRGFTVAMKSLADLPASPARLHIVVAKVDSATLMARLTDQGGQPAGSLGEQDYALRTTSVNGKNGYWAIGGGRIGTVSGGLHMAEVIAGQKVQSLTNANHSPFIEKRGIKFNIPLDARTPSHDDRGT